MLKKVTETVLGKGSTEMVIYQPLHTPAEGSTITFRINDVPNINPSFYIGTPDTYTSATLITINYDGVDNFEVTRGRATVNSEITVAYYIEVETSAYGFAEDKARVDIIDVVYPVGSIYMSVNNINPSKLFGGEWVSWGAGCVPVGVNASDTDFATAEKTGGEKTHILTTLELASHDHIVHYTTSSGHWLKVLEPTDVSSTGYYGGAISAPKIGAAVAWAATRSTSDKTGNNEPHNNLQPYITCYFWKRTA